MGTAPLAANARAPMGKPWTVMAAIVCVLFTILTPTSAPHAPDQRGELNYIADVCQRECEYLGCDEKGCGCDCGSPTTHTRCVNCMYPDEYVAAAQIALGAGLVFVLTALTVLLCKTYLRWRVQRLSGFHEPDTASLNSVERWVLSRMRDRPPRYDEAPGAAGSDKPPAYSTVERARTCDEAPPPYSLTSPLPTHTPASGELAALPTVPWRPSSGEGVINPTFVPDAEPAVAVPAVPAVPPSDVQSSGAPLTRTAASTQQVPLATLSGMVSTREI